MSTLRALGIAALLVVGMYVGFFLAWILLMQACAENGGTCGGDMMTQAVGVLYAPLFGVQ